jgi:outer membrane immunogenic protein
MRNISVAAITAISAIWFTQFASAADLPRKAPAAPPPPVFSWTGCYVGINGGWIRSNDTYGLVPSGSYLNAPGGNAPPNAAGTGDQLSSLASLSHSYDSNESGGLVGGQIGCNYQSGSVVLGVEGDWQWTGLDTSVDASYAAFPNAGNPAFTNASHTEHVTSKMDWFATLRGRLGWAFDRLLVYGTAGIAFANINSDTNVSFATFPVQPVYNGAIHLGSGSDTRVGVIAGGGLEYAFLSNWSVKAEYLYMTLGSFSYLSPLVAATAPATVGPGYSWSTNVQMRDQIVRVGLNYKFY